MIDSNETLMYSDGYDDGYSDGHDEGRADAICEFSSELTDKDEMRKYNLDDVFTAYGNYDLAYYYFREYVYAIAEQMKEKKE